MNLSPEKLAQLAMLEDDNAFATIEETGPAPKVKQAWSPLPSHALSMLQVQIFDNTANLTHGKSQYTVKLEGYYGMKGEIDCEKKDWQRSCAMIKMPGMKTWIMKNTVSGVLTPEVKALYDAAVARVDADSVDPLVEWSRIGHIMCTSTKTYYPGQFVTCTMYKDGHSMVYVCGGWDAANNAAYEWTCTKFSKKANPSPNEAIRRGIIDIYGYYRQQLQELRLLAQKAGV